MGKFQLEKENPEALTEIIKSQRQLIVSYQIQLYNAELCSNQKIQIPVRILLHHKKLYEEYLTNLTSSIEKFFSQCKLIIENRIKKITPVVSIKALEKSRQAIINLLNYENEKMFLKNMTLVETFEYDLIRRVKKKCGMIEIKSENLERRVKHIFDRNKLDYLFDCTKEEALVNVFNKDNNQSSQSTAKTEKAENSKKANKNRERETSKEKHVENPYKNVESKSKEKMGYDPKESARLKYDCNNPDKKNISFSNDTKKDDEAAVSKKLKKKKKREMKEKKKREEKEKEREMKEKKQQQEHKKIKSEPKISKISDSSSDEEEVQAKTSIKRKLEENVEAERDAPPVKKINDSVEKERSKPRVLMNPSGKKLHEKVTTPKPEKIKMDQAKKEEKKSEKSEKVVSSLALSKPSKFKSKYLSSDSDDTSSLGSDSEIMNSVKTLSKNPPLAKKKESSLTPQLPKMKKKAISLNDSVSKKDKPAVTKKPPEKPKIQFYTCYSCFKQFSYQPENGFRPDAISYNGPFKHLHLKVCVCKKCNQFLHSGEWTKDEETGKSDFCLISGDGGDIMSCDRCSNSFLIEPLQNWYSKKYVQWLDDNEEEEFACFKCDSSKGNYIKFLDESNKIFDILKQNSPSIRKKEEKEKEKDRERYPSSSSKKRKEVDSRDSDSTSTLDDSEDSDDEVSRKKIKKKKKEKIKVQSSSGHLTSSKALKQNKNVTEAAKNLGNSSDSDGDFY